MNKKGVFSKIVLFLVIISLFSVFFGENEAFCAKRRAKNSDKSVVPSLKYSRVVSLKPNITQILQSLGASDQVVGITKFCPKPNAQAEVVADYNSINLEALLRLKPDLIILSSENSQSRQFHALKQAKIPMLLVEFRSFSEFLQSYVKIGEELGLKDVAEDKAAFFKGIIAQLREFSQKNWSSSPRFAMIVQRHPLMVASGQTYVGSLFAQIGWRNAFESNQIPYPVLDEEELIREPTDFVFELVHAESGEFKAAFLNKKVIALPIQSFLASPQSLLYIQSLLVHLTQGTSPLEH
ncbi:MAG: ABC transporter substrate-binding protein [Deltaproteobacteria bacterium]|nr:ABC transporter substrate-binding protein [Deltaproteobacteria bacterium]